MKRILFFSNFIGLILPSVLIAEVTRITCTTSQWRHRFPTPEYEDKFLKWYRTNSIINFEFDEKGNYVDVYLPNKSTYRADKNLVTFRPDLITFALPVKKNLVDNEYTLDNYEINRIDGDFSRIFKTFSYENYELIYEAQFKGECKKNPNQIKLF